ncbi:MFS transporter, partial [Salmonella enterica subsp. enterica serovar Saintpaul]|nr:MFS transporter [Salmonella enterica subsp. enterica serovar Saintpaul]
TSHHADRGTALTGLIIATAIGAVSTVLWGALSDRTGRRSLYIVGSVLTIAFGFPMFLLANTGIPALIVLVYIIGLPIIHDMLAGVQ